MAGITTAVVGTAVAVKGASDARKARKNAASEQKRAAFESAQQIEKAGDKAQADILRQNALAAERVALAAEEAQERIDPFVAPGVEAFNLAQGNLLQGGEASGPIADSIRNAATSFAQRVPGAQSGPVAQEIQRQGDIAVGTATPRINQNLLQGAQQGIAAVGDVSGIRQRGLQRLSDLAQATGAQRASVLVGQTPQLANLQQQQAEAGLLSNLASRQFRTNTAESLARLAGEVF